LYEINQKYPNSFVKSAKEYLDTYIKDGYLRKFYKQEELYFELSPEVYKVIEFLETLQKKDFVGSETKFRRMREN